MGPVAGGDQGKAPGEELLFPVLLPKATEAPERKEVEVGDVAYLPPENALCLFCGHDNENINEDSPVTPVGRIVEGMEDCGLVRQNETLRIEASEG